MNFSFDKRQMILMMMMMTLFKRMDMSALLPGFNSGFFKTT
jgi:hypothetical protein